MSHTNRHHGFSIRKIFEDLSLSVLSILDFLEHKFLGFLSSSKLPTMFFNLTLFLAQLLHVAQHSRINFILPIYDLLFFNSGFMLFDLISPIYFHEDFSGAFPLNDLFTNFRNQPGILGNFIIVVQNLHRLLILNRCRQIFFVLDP